MPDAPQDAQQNSSQPPQNDELKSVTENLYKQNLELSVRNKILSLLRQLYQISILTLEPSELAEKIVTLVRETLDLEFVGIQLFRPNESPAEKSGAVTPMAASALAATPALVPLKFSFSGRLAEAQTAAGCALDQCSIADPANNSFLGDLVKNKVSVHSDQLVNVWKGCVPDAALEALAANSHLKTISAYPLIIDGTFAGVLLTGLNRPFDTLSEFERESISSLVDVTAVALDRARLYQALKVSNTQLTTANQGQTDLIHILNHQIKGYLAKGRVIFSELLTEPEYASALVTPAVKTMLSQGLAALTEGVDFVQNVLNASSIESGTMRYNMQPLDLRALIADVAEKQKIAATDKNLAYIVQLEDSAFPMTGDSLQLKEAFRNLLDNSVKYTPSGSITLALARTKTDSGASAYLFTVTDTGVGLSDEDKPKLFTQGGRGKESLRLNANSTGYGLSFVKGVVDAHHGRVWAESEGSGKGSRFFVELPALPAA